MSNSNSGRDLARAELARARANVCAHGVRLDHCATCRTARDHAETEEER